MATDTAARPWETRFLLRVAPLIFVVTVGIGIFNGFHFVQLSRAILLTHVHAGTLGWVTIGAFATAFWLVSSAGSGDNAAARWIAIAMTVAVPLYVLAFAINNFVARAVFGTPVLVIIVAMVIYILGAIRRAGWSVPALGFILAFTVLVIGSTIGVLYQIQLAAKARFPARQCHRGPRGRAGGRITPARRQHRRPARFDVGFRDYGLGMSKTEANDSALALARVILIFGAAQLLDLGTTILSFQSIGPESNPLFAPLLARSPALSLSLKLLIAIAVMLVVLRFVSVRRQHGVLMVMAAIALFGPLVNSLQLLALH